MKNRSALVSALIVVAAAFSMVSLPTKAVPYGAPVISVTASTNAGSTGTGTNSVNAGVGEIDSIYITKSTTNSSTIWITTDQGETVYSNTTVTLTTTVRPRVFPTDTGGNVNTSVAPVRIQYSGKLNLNVYGCAITNQTVTANPQIQR